MHGAAVAALLALAGVAEAQKYVYSAGPCDGDMAGAKGCDASLDFGTRAAALVATYDARKGKF